MESEWWSFLWISWRSCCCFYSLVCKYYFGHPFIWSHTFCHHSKKVGIAIYEQKFSASDSPEVAPKGRTSFRNDAARRLDWPTKLVANSELKKRHLAVELLTPSMSQNGALVHRSEFATMFSSCKKTSFTRDWATYLIHENNAFLQKSKLLWPPMLVFVSLRNLRYDFTFTILESLCEHKSESRRKCT